MNAALKQPWTVERFLAWEDKQEGKHEFDGTRIIEMTGGSRNHQRIVANLLRLLDDALDPSRFEVIQEMRVTNGTQVRYADIVVCAGPLGGKVRTLRDAIVVAEVLSEETAPTDLAAKRDDYALLPNIRHYLIIDQDAVSVKVLARSENGWRETILIKGVIDLTQIGVCLPVEAIYAKLRLP